MSQTYNEENIILPQEDLFDKKNILIEDVWVWIRLSQQGVSLHKKEKLFYKGDISILEASVRIAIVWPRKMSNYAKKVLDALFLSLARYHSVCVISWGAEGVDEYAHRMAISCGMKTIMVLWWGITYYEQSSKRQLVKQVVESWWLLLSEYEHDFQPTHYSFPQRNRIIAELSHLVFLPEAGEKSGSLLTVWYANKAWIPVCAPMQDVFNVQSAGSNLGIVDGNILPVINFDEMLAKYFWPIGWLFESSKYHSVVNDSVAHRIGDDAVGMFGWVGNETTADGSCDFSDGVGIDCGGGLSAKDIRRDAEILDMERWGDERSVQDMLVDEVMKKLVLQ